MTTMVDKEKAIGFKRIMFILLAVIMLSAILAPTVSMAYSPSNPPPGYIYSYTDCEARNCGAFWLKSQAYYIYVKKTNPSQKIFDHAGFGVCC